MTANELNLIKRAHWMVLFSVALLLIAQVSFLLVSTAQYLFAVITAVLIALIKWAYWRKSGQDDSQKTLIVLVLAITVLSPILIFLFKVIFDLDFIWYTITFKVSGTLL